MPEITREVAVEIAKSGMWKDWTDDEVVRFQLYQDRLCMDFSRFQEATEKVLGRPVWTHEFANPENLRAEYEKKKPAPSFDEILAMIPADKLVVVVEADDASGAT